MHALNVLRCACISAGIVFICCAIIEQRSTIVVSSRAMASIFAWPVALFISAVNAATESRRLADVSLATGRVRRGYARAPGELIRCCRERLERQDNAQRSRVDNVPRDGKAGLRNDLAHFVVISEHVRLEGRNASGAGDGAQPVKQVSREAFTLTGI